MDLAASCCRVRFLLDFFFPFGFLGFVSHLCESMLSVPVHRALPLNLPGAVVCFHPLHSFALRNT